MEEGKMIEDIYEMLEKTFRAGTLETETALYWIRDKIETAKREVAKEIFKSFSKYEINDYELKYVTDIYKLDKRQYERLCKKFGVV